MLFSNGKTDWVAGLNTGARTPNPLIMNENKLLYGLRGSRQLKAPLSEKALEPCVLLLHLPEPLHLILLQRPETPVPKIENLPRNFVALAGVLDGLALRFHLTRDRHDLLIRKTLLYNSSLTWIVYFLINSVELF